MGLDIGIASVGWAVLSLDADKKPFRIIDLGSRIFSAAEQPKTGASLAAPRREARGARRRLRRRRHRIERARSLLMREGVIDKQSLATLFNKPMDIYRLRASGLDILLNEDEWARVLLFFAKHRGFKSNRKSDATDKETGQVLDAIKENAKLLKGYRTAGEMLFKDEHFHGNKRNRAGTYTATMKRDDLIDEIHQLFAAQRKLGNAHASESFEDTYISVFSSQRGFDEGPGFSGSTGGHHSENDDFLSPIEKMIGNCSLEQGEKRAPKASYSFMLFSLLQAINHIRLLHRLDDGGIEKIPLDQSERDAIISYAFESPTLTYEKIRKILNLDEKFRFKGLPYRENPNDKKSEPYNKTEAKTKINLMAPYHEIRKAFDHIEKNHIKNFLPTEQERIDALDAIAYAFTAFKSDDNIRRYLSKNSALTDSDINCLTENLGTFSKFGHISIKATRKLIPYLRQGSAYSDACSMAGYAPPAPDTGLYLPKTSDELDDITNPVVRRAVRQTIKVINAIIRRYGSPFEIHIELARELPRSFSERREMTDSMNENKALNDRIVEKIKSHGVLHPTGQDIVKWKLYEEQGERCMYSGAGLTADQVLSDATEVDHVLPYSRSFDDSYANKVLVLTGENRKKRDRTAMEYFHEDKTEKELNDFLVRAAHAKSQRKRRILITEHFDGDAENAWKDRHLKDTQTINSLLPRFIERHLIFAAPKGKRHVVPVNGAITAYLRKRLGLQKIRENGDLHHAQDAVVIACTSFAMINQISNAAKRHELNSERSRIEEPWPRFTDELDARLSDNPQVILDSLHLPTYPAEEIEEIQPPFVSRASRHKISGAAHKDTLLSPRMIGDGIVVHRIPLTLLTPTNIKNYYNPSSDKLLYDALLARLKEYNGDGKKAFKDDFYKPKADGTKGPLVKTVKIAEKSTLNVPLNQGKSVAGNGESIRIDVFHVKEKRGDITKGYYFIPIYASDCVKSELPRRACVANKPYDQWPEMSDEDFIFSLYQNDLIYVEHTKSLKMSLINKNSKRPSTYEAKGALLYYQGANIHSGAIKVIDNQNVYEIGGLGIKTLVKIEKYEIDVLGAHHSAAKEKRKSFNR